MGFEDGQNLDRLEERGIVLPLDLGKGWSPELHTLDGPTLVILWPSPSTKGNVL